MAFAAVDAALELANNISPASTILAFEVAVSSRAAQLGGNPLPATADEAIVSIPYLVARTLTDPSSVSRSITAQFAISPREQEMLSAIRIVVDPMLADSAAHISLNDGELEVACKAARGSAGKPLAVSEVVDKFRLICGLSDPGRIVDAVMRGDCDLGALLPELMDG